MSVRPDPARARHRIPTWTIAGLLAGLVVLVGWFGLRSTSADESASADRAASSTSPSTDPASRRRDSTRRPPLRADLAASAANEPVDSAKPPTAMAVPLPARFGGGKPVSPSTTELAARLQLAPTELAELAGEPGGDLPPTIIRRLEDAHAQGAALGDRLGLDPPEAQLLAGRFTNQLLRLERQLQLSPRPVKFDDVLEMVTRDTLEDLRRNLGDDVADAAAPDVRSLKPLRPAE